MDTSAPHEAQKLPLNERVDYLMVVASMAGADVELTQGELDQVRALCKALALPDAETTSVVDAARQPTHRVRHHVENLRGSDLRFALLTDCIALAYADGEYEKGEKKEITALATELGVGPEQLAALEDGYRTLHAAEIAEHYKDHHGVKAVASRLAAVGIPVGVAGGLSAFGLSTAGIASGAAAVGLGLGIAGGVGAVLGAGVGTILGVRWLHDRLQQRKG